MKTTFRGEDVEFSLRSFEYEVRSTPSLILKSLLSGSMWQVLG